MTCGTSSAQTRDDSRVNEEREEAQVMIACGFDVHRAQITFDLVDHETGELRRGRIAPATRERLRVWLAGMDGARVDRVAGPVDLLDGDVVDEVTSPGQGLVLSRQGLDRVLRVRE